MKLVTLVENTSTSDRITAEHGLSLYIETGALKILFDMGQTDRFLKNAEQLGIDLSQVDFAVLSHGHYDHGGGLGAFLQINTKAPVYIHKTAFGAYYNGTSKYIGLDQALMAEKRLIFTEGTFAITPQILLADCNDLHWRNDPYGLNRKEQDLFVPDDFRHEQYLQITEGEKRILLSGCSHKGILHIAKYFQPRVLIGGFHLNKVTDMQILRETARDLMERNTRYYTGHCTGDAQFSVMKEVMGDQLERISAGAVIQV